MLRVIAGGCLATLTVLQSVQPVRACDWCYVEEPCCCEWYCCEPLVLDCSACWCAGAPMVIDDCGCGGEGAIVAESSDEGQPSTTAETQKPEQRATDTPQPALDATELPPAPINVPGAATPSTTSELFPGPATETTPPAEVTQPATPPAESTAVPSAATESLFDEPSAEPATSAPEAAEPAPSAEVPAAEPESSSVDDVFGEPSPPADDSPSEIPADEDETTETETTSEPATETDPLEDLFGPSSAVEHPESNHELASEIPEKDAPARVIFRQWTQREGRVSWEARLVSLTSEGVFLANPAGELTAVAYSQLSDADLTYLREYVRDQRLQLAQQALGASVASQTSR